MYAPFPSKSCPTRSGGMPSRNPETRIVRRQSRTTSRVYPQVSLQLSSISEESQTTGRRSPITAACHWDVIYDRILKPTTPSRNLLLKPYILWLRDSERLPTAGVYSGHLSSQGLQVQTLKPGEAIHATHFSKTSRRRAKYTVRRATFLWRRTRPDSRSRGPSYSAGPANDYSGPECPTRTAAAGSSEGSR